MRKKTMKQIMRKLKQRSGETLTETLVALLVGVMALAMLASMIGSTTKIITQSQETMTEYYEESAAMIRKDTPSSTGYMMLKDNSNNSYTLHLVPDNITSEDTSSSGKVAITYYSNTEAGDENPVVTYK